MRALPTDQMDVVDQQLSVVLNKAIILIFLPLLIGLKMTAFWCKLEWMNYRVENSLMASIGLVDEGLLPWLSLIDLCSLAAQKGIEGVSFLIGHDFILTVDIFVSFANSDCS